MTLCLLVLAQRVVTGGGDGPALMFPACSITLTFHCVLFQSCGDGDGRAGNRPNYCRVEMDQPFLRQIEPPDLAKVRYIWYPCAVLHIWSLWWFCLFRTSISGPERLCCPETWSFLSSSGFSILGCSDCTRRPAMHPPISRQSDTDSNVFANHRRSTDGPPQVQ